MIKLTLPYPLSSNKYWRPVRIGKQITIVPTAEAKSFKSELAWLCRKAGIKKPFTGRIELCIKLYPKRPLDALRRMRKDPETWDDDVQCIDLGNCEKVLSDALNGVAWVDDKQHRRIVLERMEPDGEARMEVSIREISTTRMQGSLL